MSRWQPIREIETAPDNALIIYTDRVRRWMGLKDYRLWHDFKGEHRPTDFYVVHPAMPDYEKGKP